LQGMQQCFTQQPWIVLITEPDANVGLPAFSGGGISSLMPPIQSFENAPAHDDGGRLVIKSTCKNCGAFRFVNVRDGSLAKWESRHECPDAARIPPCTGPIVQ
jgi:hypothetical protein